MTTRRYSGVSIVTKTSAPSQLRAASSWLAADAAPAHSSMTKVAMTRIVPLGAAAQQLEDERRQRDDEEDAHDVMRRHIGDVDAEPPPSPLSAAAKPAVMPSRMAVAPTASASARRICATAMPAKRQPTPAPITTCATAISSAGGREAGRPAECTTGLSA